MSLMVSDNSLYLKNPETNEFLTVSIFNSGADKSMEKIAEFAEATKSEAEAVMTAKKTEISEGFREQLESQVDGVISNAKVSAEAAIEAKKNEVLGEIPDSYTELQDSVNQVKDDIVELEKGVRYSNLVDMRMYEEPVRGITATKTRLDSGESIGNIDRIVWVKISCVPGKSYKYKVIFTRYNNVNVRIYKSDKSTLIKDMVSDTEYSITPDADTIYLRVFIGAGGTIVISDSYFLVADSITYTVDAIVNDTENIHKSIDSICKIAGVVDTSSLCIGIINPVSAKIIANSKRASILKSKYKPYQILYLNDGIQGIAYYYDTAGTYVESATTSFSSTIMFKSGYEYISFAFKNGTDTDITQDDIDSIIASFNAIDINYDIKFKNIFKNHPTTTQSKQMESVVKDIYISDENKKGNIRLCVLRAQSSTPIWQIRMYDFATGNAVLYADYTTTEMPKSSVQFIKFSVNEAYAMIDWSMIVDGTSITGMTSDIYTISDACFELQTNSNMWGYIASIADSDNENIIGDFDTVNTGEINTTLIGIGRNSSVPYGDTGNIYISTDIEIAKMWDSVNESDMLESMIPYLYFNGKKVGTVLIYDDDGAYFFDKDGTKKRVVTQEV